MAPVVPIPERPYPGRLELDGKLTAAAAARTARYLPLGLPAGTRDYVERAVRGGRITRATFRVNGDLAEFPFRPGRAGQPGTGEFHVAAQLDDVTFAYAPGERTGATRAPDPWPALTQASGELVLDPGETLRPGDELIVLPYLDPKAFQIGSDLLAVIYQIAVATRIFL